MTAPADPHAILTLEQLARMYDAPGEASLLKEVPRVLPQYKALIEASPFAVLATCGPDGLDASPRGDPPGFVVVQDEHTLLIPDRRGNNRIDSLRNIVADPRVALLFLIPGIGETLRVNGRAHLSVDPAMLARCSVEGKAPKCVIVVAVQTVFFQCSRAILRSHLWDPALQRRREELPTPGSILAQVGGTGFDGEKYDRDLPGRLSGSLY
jgi:hypothetical protein